MAIPTISNTTSVLGFDQGDKVNYQPFASDSPTSWSASNLPPGITIDGTTGLLSGSADEAGVFVAGLVATNGEGSSAAHEIAIGIGPKEVPDGLGVLFDIDLQTAAVSLQGVETADGNPVLFAKEGDQILIDLGFWQNGELQEIPLTAAKFTIREFDGETELVLSDGVATQIGTGPNTRFRILVDFDDPDLAGVFSAYEGDVRTGFNAIAEIEWEVLHGDAALAPSSAVRTTQTFRVATDRDLIA